MAVITGTQLTTTPTLGNREDLADIIYMLKPVETPFMNGIGRSTATATKHEWQQDSPNAVNAANAVAEGLDTPAGSTTHTYWARLGNVCQISTKNVVVSGTQEAVAKAGRKSDVAHIMAKRGMELKRDMEAGLCQLGVASASDPRTFAGFETWIRTAAPAGASYAGASPKPRGTNGAPGSAYSSGLATGLPTDGTLRTFDEEIFKLQLQVIYGQGGTTNLVIAPPIMKQRISGFSGSATAMTGVVKQNDMASKTLQTAIDVYVSDFGTLSIVPSRFCRTVSVLLCDTEYLGVAYLRPFQSFPLAKTGDAEQREILAEYCLEMRNELAQGICADLQ